METETPNVKIAHKIFMVSFLCGLLIDWGTLDVAAFPIGIYHRRILDPHFRKTILKYITNVLPLFVIGITISKISLLRFGVFLVLGYICSDTKIDIEKMKTFCIDKQISYLLPFVNHLEVIKNTLYSVIFLPNSVEDNKEE